MSNTNKVNDGEKTIKQPSKGTRISDILWKNVKPAVAKPTECKTFASACEAMAWERSEQADNYINLQGEMPEMLRSKVVDEQYFLMGYTANDMKEQFGGSNFSYDDLKKNFGEICEDFTTEFTMTDRKYCIEFAARHIYEVAPKSRKDKSKDFVVTYNFPCELREKDDAYNIVVKKMFKTLYVLTIRKDKLPEKYKYSKNAMF